MAVPTKDWSDIADSRVDSESPLDTMLMTQIRDNLVHLREWLGTSYTAAADHDHDGVNSRSVVLADGAVVAAKLADANVTLAKLKLAQGSWSGNIGSTSHVYVSLSTYAHIPGVGGTNTSFVEWELGGGSSGANSGPFKAHGYNTDTNGTQTGHVVWNYHIN